MAPVWKWSKKYEGWTTEVTLPRLAAWRNLWNLFPGQVDGPYEAEEVDPCLNVLIRGPETGRRPEQPSAAQLAALKRLPEDEDTLDGALAKYLFYAMRQGYLGQIIPEPGDAENEEERRIYSHLHRPEAMRELVQLNDVEILADEEDGLSRVVLSFGSAFDEEHGLRVCIHGTKVLSHGGMGEQGGWPPPGEDALAEMAAVYGLAPARDPQARLRETLETALTDPITSPAIVELTQAALALIDDPNQQLEITVRIDTPPVTRVEKVYYGQAGTLSYDLTIGVGLDHVIYKDSTTPRQAGLQGAPWPLSLFAAQCKWPHARPRLDTVKVRQLDKAASLRKAKPMGPELPDLRATAQAALREGFDPAALKARGWRLTPDPYDMPQEDDPSLQEQALGAGMRQGMMALRGLLGGDPTAPPPPDFAALIAGAAGAPGTMGLLAGMMAQCELIPVPPARWCWSNEAQGKAAEKALTQAGLQRVGCYQVVLPFAPMFAAYVDPNSRLYALVLDDLYQRTITVECRSHYTDGQVFATTTRAAAAASGLPPWLRLEVLKICTQPGDVLQRFLARRPADGLAPVSGDRFVSDYQDLWRRETQWRSSQKR
ncbi:MAG: hypothetical protein U0840_00610 [Gemmataceae bacterium]